MGEPEEDQRGGTFQVLLRHGPSFLVDEPEGTADGGGRLPVLAGHEDHSDRHQKSDRAEQEGQQGQGKTRGRRTGGVW